MRLLERNKVQLYYALFEVESMVEDEYGNLTGEHTTKYGKPVSLRANISAAQGETETRQFGADLSYDKVIVIENDVPIDEFSVLWIDTLPKIEKDGSTETPYDYVVKKVAKSLNHTTLAIKKVMVN